MLKCVGVAAKKTEMDKHNAQITSRLLPQPDV